MQKSLSCARMVLAFCLGAAALGAWAGDPVYRWVDKEGVIHYGAQPPDKDAKPAALPSIQTYSSRSGAKLSLPSRTDAAPKAGSSLKEVRILAPVQDEIFRDADAAVSVSVAVLPALPEGAGVIFYLDGAPRSARPSPATSTNLAGLDRGEHQVSAAVVDATGKELMRSLPVTFHTKPPVAR